LNHPGAEADDFEACEDESIARRMIGDTRIAKRGRKMAGLSKIWDHAEQRFVRGHIVITAALRFRGLIWPWQIELWLSLRHTGKKAYRKMTDIAASQLVSGNRQPWTTFPRTGLDTTALGHALAFSPDGKHLAAVNRYGQGGCRVGAVTGQGPVRECKCERCAAFSPDGKWLATADQSSICWHDWQQNSPLRVFSSKDRKTRVQRLAFSPDGQFLAVGRVDVKDRADLEIWGVATGTLRFCWRDHLATITCLSFSPDGKLLASGSLDKTVILWDMAGGQVKTRIMPNPGQVVWSLAFAPHGAILAIATGHADFRVKQAGELILWDFDIDKIRPSFHGHSRAVTSVVFSKDGQSLRTGSADTTVRFLELKSGRQYGMLKGHKAAPGFEAIVVALSQDGASLATASFDQTVRIWPTTWIRVQRPVGAFRLETGSPWFASLAVRGNVRPVSRLGPSPVQP
jgi:WD40 repeat protein